MMRRDSRGLSVMLGRWWVVGLAALAVSFPVLYGLRDGLGLSVPVATLIYVEIGTIWRFLVTDRWVFSHPRTTWRRLAKYHLATASSFVVWWAVTNALSMFGLHYLLASVAGTAGSVTVSMATNFLWIWRDRASPASPRPMRYERVGGCGSWGGRAWGGW